MNLREAKPLIAMLRDDLREEWLENHEEHCDCNRDGATECHWQPALTLRTGDVDWLEKRRLSEREDAPYLGKYFRYGYLVVPEGDDPGPGIEVEEGLLRWFDVDKPLGADVVPEVVDQLARPNATQDPVVNVFRPVPDGALVQDGMIANSQSGAE